VMDTEPEPPAVETTTLLVDWPVETERPRRCAFVYAESQCPPSLRQLLAFEQAAREREMLNALYVAMTRARRRLVFSATEPFRPAPGVSWWSRVATGAAAWMPGPTQGAIAATATPSPTMKAAPLWRRELGPSTVSRGSGDPRAAAIGRAVHRVLEWSGSAPDSSVAIAEAAAAAAREFGAVKAVVERSARAILESPECSRFFAGPHLRWSGNEVPLAWQGEVLRLDRLVLLGNADDGGDGRSDERRWWVLDYKLSHTPEALVPYREQLLRYRDAVRAAQPGEAVHCAFITGEGRVVEID
jgi:ATP-dependent helicase/nuclease subunit A